MDLRPPLVVGAAPQGDIRFENVIFAYPAGDGLVVAHRPSTIRRADLVVVLREGRVVEAGPPDELQAAGGEFARLINAPTP